MTTPASAVDLFLETYVDLCDLMDLAISPDGRWATVTVTGVSRPEVERQAAVWLVDLTGAQQPRQMTAGTADDANAEWSPDGTRVAFLSDRAERKTRQAYVLTLDALAGGGGGEALPVTDEPGGVSAVHWLPDGERLLVLSVAAQDKAEQERKKRERDDAKVSDEFHANATPMLIALDGTVLERYPMEGHVAAAAVAPDGERVAFTRWATPGIDSSMNSPMLGILDLASGDISDVGESGRFGGVPYWSLDGRTVYTTAISAPTPVGSMQLVGITLDDTPTREVITRGNPWCVEGIVGVTEAGVMIRIAEGVISRLAVLGADGSLTDIDGVPGIITGGAVTTDGQGLAVIAQTPEWPMEIYARRGGAFEKVTNFQAAATSIPLGEQHVVTWEREGMALDAILLLPPGVAKDEAQGLPLICCVHGGPYGRWAMGYYGHRFGRYLAALGYAVIYPNPRGGSGHGEAFAESVLHCVGDDDYLDVMSSVDLMIEQGIADPEQLGICGWSQGGFMTAWAVGHTTRFGAAVMGAGVSDWGMMVATSDIPTYEVLMGGGNPYESVGPHGFDKQSPISFVSNATTPTLILHGENDERVPLNQAEFFYRGLKTYGVPTQLVAYPREPHGIRERRHQIDLMQRTADWFQRWLPTGVEGDAETSADAATASA